GLLGTGFLGAGLLSASLLDAGLLSTGLLGAGLRAVRRGTGLLGGCLPAGRFRRTWLRRVLATGLGWFRRPGTRRRGRIARRYLRLVRGGSPLLRHALAA